ncbi:V-set domain-containing T-cell activation inhibitor 1 [Oreochromis niloticus]|uniref:V-set domain-containing T-cell activation inhibitor 1 n=1 Tax=Oreochromis niloticus TaxID=8128 RepID=UPI000393E3EC|nr:V-set domain-containing T-cell activation inhibitor 1 [Oreochromis niloticus]CAI5660468.1 unnamed protein product [Mustela putorius furo]
MPPVTAVLHWNVGLLFVFLLEFTSADQKNITAKSGQDVTLPCQAPDNNIIMIIEWSKTDLKEEYVFVYRNKMPDLENQHPSFKNRVDLQDIQMKDGDVSLILNNVTINDTGTYQCHVFTTKTQRKRENHSVVPISIIYLHVDPPGQTGGHTEDGSVGLIVDHFLLWFWLLLLVL